MVFQFGHFCLDVKSQALYYKSEEIELEPRVFEVLYLMLQRPNEVITKDEFFEFVWEGKIVSDWALSRAIKEVRKKLREHQDLNWVKTLYGKGYLFASDVKLIDQNAFNALRTGQSYKTPNTKNQPKAIENNRTETPFSQATSNYKRVANKLLIAFLLLNLVLIPTYFIFIQESNVVKKTTTQSIVVLPISNISDSEEMEYLASGLTDVIIGRLAQQKDLRVISKTSALYYKNKQMSSSDIAEALNVDTVLEGSIYPEKGRINLSLRLINAQSEDLIWSLDESEPVQEIYSLFKNIATKVAKRIVPNLSPERQKLLYEKTNHETFELYLRANYLLNSRRGKFLRDAETLLLLAIEKDPYFAEAYAKLATVYIVMSSYTTGKRIDWFKLAKEYTDDALILAPNSSIAWTNLGLIELGYNYNLQEAKKAFDKAISINPNNIDAKQSLSELLAITSKYDQALALLEETWRRDSMNPLLIAVWASTLMMDKQFEKAIEKYELAKSFGSQMIWIDRDIAYIHQWRGDDSLSLEFRYLEMKNIGYFKKGDQDFIKATKQNGILGFWQWRLPILLNKWQEGRLHGCYIAEAYAGIKDYKKMLEWFNTGLEQKSEICFQLVKRSPEFYRFKNEPEFKALLSNYDIML